MTSRPQRVAVVVPAHDEEELLPGCLEALARAVSNVAEPVLVVVVLDDCRDRSATVCSWFDVVTIRLRARNVGAARRAGVDRALTGGRIDHDLWLAHTDADSRVGPEWLAEQLGLAESGADAVVGVVHLPEPDHRLHVTHQSAYRHRIRPDGTHDHAHGANLGLRASAYMDIGGFRPLRVHEDRDLIRRLDRACTLRVVRSATLTVETSPRLVGRCSEGFAADLTAADSMSPPLRTVRTGPYGSSTGSEKVGVAEGEDAAV